MTDHKVNIPRSDNEERFDLKHQALLAPQGGDASKTFHMSVGECMATGDARYLQLSRDLRHVLAGEWLAHILAALSKGPLHYNELHAAIQDMATFDPWTGTERRIQSRALGRTLRRMEAAGLVDRVEEQSFPRSVVYSITPAATDLLARGQPLIDWAEENFDLIKRLQTALTTSREGYSPSSDRRTTAGDLPG